MQHMSKLRIRFSPVSLQPAPVFADPLGSNLLICLAGSNTQHECDDLWLCGVNLVPVPAEEDVRRNEAPGTSPIHLASSRSATAFFRIEARAA